MIGMARCAPVEPCGLDHTAPGGSVKHSSQPLFLLFRCLSDARIGAFVPANRAFAETGTQKKF